MRALGLHVDRVKRLAAGHEQAVALGAAEADVGADFRQHDLADAVAVRREDMDAVVAVADPAGAGPDIAVDVAADAVGEAGADAVERHVGEAAALFADAGAICISAFISPYWGDRDRARAATERLVPGGFHEVFVSADLAVCEQRDPKGLYARARRGEIRDFTGISAPYEAPVAPDLTVDTGQLSVEACLEALVGYCESHFAIRPVNQLD